MSNHSKNVMVQSILFTCEHQKKYGDEQVVLEHALGYIVSGKIQFQTNGKTTVHEAGNIGLIRRNELIRAIKMPDDNGLPFKAINIFLDQNSLRNYAAENNIPKQEKYVGHTIIDFSKNKFIRAYFESLVPYFNEPEKLAKKLAELKIKEAIELILEVSDDYKTFLFDLSEPFKIDLEKYMKKNFVYNIPTREFARLSGRSLSTFKRDFKNLFDTTPEKWLQEKRLEEARFLITEKKQKPTDVYIQVGFENLSHFSYAFKKMYGVSPNQLKK
jgi:AraC-like DNA-binding protein